MSKITRKDILKLAQLSRISITEDEIDKYSDEITAILDYVEQLQNVDLDGVEPTYQVTGLKDVMRKDVVIDYGTTQTDLLQNAPQIKDNHFKVKRMVG